jgi:hypothetical protein
MSDKLASPPTWTSTSRPVLSRRDEFAKAAIQGMAANPEWDGPTTELAAQAVRYADALIAELDKDQP